MADDRIGVKIAADLADFRRGMREAGGELDSFARKGREAETSLGGVNKAAGQTSAGAQTLTQRTREAYGITETMTRAQASQIRALETANVALGLHGRELAVYTALRRANTTAETEAGRTITLLAQRHYDLTNATEKAAEGHTRLSTQAMALQHSMRSSIEQLALGVPVTQVLTQQMNHLSYAATGSGGLTGAFKEVGSIAATAGRGLISFLSDPIKAAIAGTAILATTIGATAHSADAAQVGLQRSLSGTGRIAGVTSGDLIEVARSTSSWSTISQKEAREAAAAFANAGVIGRDNLGAANRVALDFAKTLGVDLDEGIKILAKDLTSGVPGIDDLNNRIGGLTVTQREYLKDLDANLDKTKFQATAIQFVAQNVSKASDLTTAWGQRWNVLANAASDAANAIKGPADAGPLRTIRQQIDALERERDAFRSFSESTGRGDGSALQRFSDQIVTLRLEATRLEAKDISAKFAEWGQAAMHAAQQMTPLRVQAEELERRLKLLQQAQASPEVRLTLSPQQNKQLDEAVNALRVQARLSAEAADQAARHNEQVLKLGEEYKGVTLSTAMVLRDQRDQLMVASAVTGQEKLAAQEKATFNKLVFDGVKAEEAARIAAGERATAQAQINSQARATLLTLQDQFAVASAITGSERIRAEAQATLNQLVRLGVDESTASGVAAQQEANARAQVNAQVEQQTIALNQQTELIRARLSGTEATVAAEQAYTNAVKAGADSRRAANAEEAAYTRVIAEQEAKEAEQRQKAAEQEEKKREQANKSVSDNIYNMGKEMDLLGARDAQDAARIKSIHAYNDAIRAGASLWAAQAAEAATLALELAKAEKAAREIERQRAVSAAKAAAQAIGGDTRSAGPNGYPSAVATPLAFLAAAYGGEGGYTVQKSPLGALYDRLIPTEAGYQNIVDKYLSGRGSSLTSGWGGEGALGAFSGLLDNATRMATQSNTGFNDAAASMLSRLADLLPDEQKSLAIGQEIAKLNDTPRTLARDELIKSLTEQLKQLTDATKDNTDAMTLRLDPLFSEGHAYLDKARIGFYEAAGGMTGIVTGGSGVRDDVPVPLMLSRGERVQVDPQGQWGKNDWWRQASVVSSDNNSRSFVTNVTNFINIRSTDGPRSRYVMRQLQQGFGRAIAGALS